MPLPSRPSAASGHPGAPVRSRRAIRFGLAAAIALASVIASEQPANAQPGARADHGVGAVAAGRGG